LTYIPWIEQPVSPGGGGGGLPDVGEGVTFNPNAILTNDHFMLMVPKDGFPGFDELALEAPIEDWFVATPELGTQLGITWTDPGLDYDQQLNITSVLGVGAEIVHHATPTSAIQERGDVTLRCVFNPKSLTTGMTYKLASVQGVSDWTALDDNVLCEIEITDPDTFQAKHESGTDVDRRGTWEIPVDLFGGVTYDLTGKRASDTWSLYLNGYKLTNLSAFTGGSDAGSGDFAASASAENGNNAVFSLERGRVRMFVCEGMSVALTDQEISDRVIRTTDRRLDILAQGEQEIADIFETGNELMFLVPDPSAPDKVVDRTNTLDSTWVSSPATVNPSLANGSYAQGVNNQAGYRSSSQAPDVLAGGGDFVYRYAGIWEDGDTLATLRRPFGASINSSSVNVHGYLFLSDNSTFALLQQFGSKQNSSVTFTTPFPLVNEDPFLIVIEQQDNGNGTQDVRAWLNGVPCTVSAVQAGTDNLDGSATITDGSINGATEWCWLAVGFSGDSTFSKGLFLQVDLGTTDTATEEALATAYLGGLGSAHPRDLP